MLLRMLMYVKLNELAWIKHGEAVFLEKLRFRLPALRSALLCKADVYPPWSTHICTNAGRSVGIISWISNNNRTVTNMTAIDEA